VLHRRPEIAHEIASLLAERRMRLSEVRDDLDSAARDRSLEQEKSALLSRMRSFFGL
jgi:hypothetical protein